MVDVHKDVPEWRYLLESSQRVVSLLTTEFNFEESDEADNLRWLAKWHIAEDELLKATLLARVHRPVDPPWLDAITDWYALQALGASSQSDG